MMENIQNCQPQPPLETPEQALEEENKAIEEMRGMIDQILKELEFPERSEDRDVREEIVGQDGKIKQEPLMRWTVVMQGRIDEIKDSTLNEKAQLGLIIATATIHLKTKNHVSFFEDIDDAIIYAENKRYPEITEKLKKL